MENDSHIFNKKRSVINIVNEAMGTLEGAGYIIQEMQRHKSYGKLTKLRMDLLRQKKFLKIVHEFIKEN